MRIKLTSNNGFIASHLIKNFNIVEEDYDVLFLIASPTSEAKNIEDLKEYHKYVDDSINIIKKEIKPIIFFSTSDVYHISSGNIFENMYALSKIYIESNILTYSKNFLILRLPIILSRNKIDIINQPKRIQNEVFNKIYNYDMNEIFEVTFIDDLLVNIKKLIENIDNKIIDIDFKKIKFIDLIKLNKEII